MTVCRDLDEVRAAARNDAKDDPPLTQAGADLVAALRTALQDRPDPLAVAGLQARMPPV